MHTQFHALRSGLLNSSLLWFAIIVSILYHLKYILIKTMEVAPLGRVQKFLLLQLLYSGLSHQ